MTTHLLQAHIPAAFRIPLYVAGTDKKTVGIVAKLIADINEKMDAGDFQATERMINDATNARNIPFRIEFAAQFEGVF